MFLKITLLSLLRLLKQQSKQDIFTILMRTLLNVRPKPSTSEAAIGKLSEGETVVIVGESGNWYEIEYNNSTAYVSKDYVTLNCSTTSSRC